MGMFTTLLLGGGLLIMGNQYAESQDMTLMELIQDFLSKGMGLLEDTLGMDFGYEDESEPGQEDTGTPGSTDAPGEPAEPGDQAEPAEPADAASENPGDAEPGEPDEPGEPGEEGNAGNSSTEAPAEPAEEAAAEPSDIFDPSNAESIIDNYKDPVNGDGLYGDLAKDQLANYNFNHDTNINIRFTANEVAEAEVNQIYNAGYQIYGPKIDVDGNFQKIAGSDEIAYGPLTLDEAQKAMSRPEPGKTISKSVEYCKVDGEVDRTLFPTGLQNSLNSCFDLSNKEANPLGMCIITPETAEKMNAIIDENGTINIDEWQEQGAVINPPSSQGLGDKSLSQETVKASAGSVAKEAAAVVEDQAKAKGEEKEQGRD